MVTSAPAFRAPLLPRWVRLDLTEPVRQQLTDAVARMVEEIDPAVREKLRDQLQEQLFTAMTALAADGVTTVFLPTENPAFAAAFPVLAVAPADFTVDGEQMAPMDYLVGLIGAGNSTLIEPRDMVGVRTATDRDSTAQLSSTLGELPADLREAMNPQQLEAATGATRLSREIRYLIGVPESEDRWLEVTASLAVLKSEGSDELLAAITEFADRWVETIEWVPEEDETSA